MGGYCGDTLPAGPTCFTEPVKLVLRAVKLVSELDTVTVVGLVDSKLVFPVLVLANFTAVEATADL